MATLIIKQRRDNDSTLYAEQMMSFCREIINDFYSSLLEDAF